MDRVLFISYSRLTYFYSTISTYTFELIKTFEKGIDIKELLLTRGKKTITRKETYSV